MVREMGYVQEREIQRREKEYMRTENVITKEREIGYMNYGGERIKILF